MKRDARKIQGQKNLRTLCDRLRARKKLLQYINPYPTAFPYGNGMVLHFYQQQESSTTKTYTKSLTRDLKRMYSRLTLVRISINL